MKNNLIASNFSRSRKDGGVFGRTLGTFQCCFFSSLNLEDSIICPLPRCDLDGVPLPFRARRERAAKGNRGERRARLCPPGSGEITFFFWPILKFRQFLSSLQVSHVVRRTLCPSVPHFPAREFLACFLAGARMSFQFANYRAE